MKIKNIFKIMIFTLIFGGSLIILSGASISEAKELVVDTSFDTILSSINTILERNQQYENVDKIVKNINFNSCSDTSNVFCYENNDTKLLKVRDNRVNRIEKIINLHRVNFLNYDFNLL